MRAVVQRVSSAKVTVDERVTGAIETGLLALLGVGREDSAETARALAGKIARLRIFADAAGKMNLSVLDLDGAILAVSQFTLLADTRKGNRPSFTQAAPPEQAESLYNEFCAELARQGLRVERGVFGAHMDVQLVNDGPVTIMLDL